MTDKTSIADWSTTADDNDNIAGITLEENKMRPRDVNGALRELMAQVKDGTGLDLTNATGLPLAALPKGTAGYGLMGNGAAAPSFQGFTYPATGAVARTWQAKAQEIASVLDFGAVGNCTGVGLGTDDAGAIQKAFTWLVGASNRKIVFPAGYRFRVGSTCTANFGGTISGSQLQMLSPITPDAFAGNVFEFINAGAFGDGRLDLWQLQGGQDADYTQADPTGAQQTFYIRGLRNWVVNLRARNPVNRVMRITMEHAGEIKTSNITISSIVFEATTTGQSMYLDASSSFGHAVSIYDYYPKYGSVLSGVDDFMFSMWESSLTSTAASGILIDTVASFNGGVLATGGGSTNPTGPGITLKNVGNSHINTIFSTGVSTGLYILNCGGSAGSQDYALSIDELETASSATVGVSISNSFGVKIGRHQSKYDTTPILIDGTCQRIEYGQQAFSTVGNGGTILSGAGNIIVRGFAENLNINSASNCYGWDVQTTGTVIFDNYVISSSLVVSLFNLVSGNNTKLIGGVASAAGSTTVFGANPPKGTNQVTGYRSRNIGSGIIPSGSSSVTVNHGLAGTPSAIFLSSRTTGAPVPSSSSYTSTQFNINVASAVGANTTYEWEAYLGSEFP